MIGEFLSHRLKGNQLEAFEMSLLEDPVLQSEVELQMALKKGLTDLAEEDEETSELEQPPPFDQVLYIENLRGAADQISFDSAESVCFAVDVGPIYLETVSVEIRRSGEMIQTEQFIVDPEGLINIPWQGRAIGVYEIVIRGSGVDRTVSINAT